MSTSREEIDRLLNPPKFTPAAGTDRKLTEIEEKNPIMGAHARAFMDYARENGVPDAYIKSGYRTAERQNYLHTHGYPTKGNDGYTKISPHQDARAIDWSSSPATRKKLHSLLTTFASERGLHVPGDEPWHMALPKDRVNVSRDALDEILGLSPMGEKSTFQEPVSAPTYNVQQPQDLPPEVAKPAPDIPESIPAVALPTAPTYKPPPRPARAADEFTAAETGDEPIKPFDKEWAGALGQIGNAGPEAQQAYLEFVRRNTKEGKVDAAISDEANAQTFVKIQTFLAQNPDASPEDLTKGIADIGLEFLNDPATKGKVLPKSLHDAMLRAPYAPDEVEKLPKKIQQQRQQFVATEQRRSAETALQKQTATLAKNAPDKLAAHIAWHFGPQTLAAIGSLPASKQRQIATMAVRAAADDEVRKARGEQIVESADYQAIMRKRAGVSDDMLVKKPIYAEKASLPTEQGLFGGNPMIPVDRTTSRRAAEQERIIAEEKNRTVMPGDPSLEKRLKARGVNIETSSQRPYERSVLEGEPSFGETGKSAINSLIQGLADIPASLLDAAAIGSFNLDKYGLGGLAPLSSSAISSMMGDKPYKAASETIEAQWAKGLREVAAERFPGDHRLQGEFVEDTVPRALGSLLGFAAGGWITKSATLVPAIMGAGVGMSAGYQDAIQAGASEDDATMSALLNGVVGTTEALPISRMLKRLNQASGGTLTHALVSMGKEGTKEAAQELFQSVAGNTIARKIYDKERNYLDGVLESTSAGGVTGSIASLIVSAATGMKARGRAGRNTQTQSTEVSDVVQERSTEAVSVGEPPGDRGEVGARVPESREVVQPRNVRDAERRLVEEIQAQAAKEAPQVETVSSGEAVAREKIDRLLGEDFIPPKGEQADWLDYTPAERAKIVKEVEAEGAPAAQQAASTSSVGEGLAAESVTELPSGFTRAQGAKPEGVDWLLYKDSQGKVIGRGALEGNQIVGLEVLPENRSKGYGAQILNDLIGRGGREAVAGSSESYDLYRKVGRQKEGSANRFEFQPTEQAASPSLPVEPQKAVQGDEAASAKVTTAERSLVVEPKSVSDTRSKEAAPPAVRDDSVALAREAVAVAHRKVTRRMDAATTEMSKSRNKGEMDVLWKEVQELQKFDTAHSKHPLLVALGNAQARLEQIKKVAPFTSEPDAVIVKPYKPRSRAVDTQTMSLSQAVRAAGGVKADRDLANQGEISRLSNKEAATSGLVNNRSGSKVEDMAMVMAEQGYRGDWVRVEQDRSAMQGQYFEINADKFLEAVENDQRGISPSHSMERNMDFDAEYRKEFPGEMASYDNMVSLMEHPEAGKIYDKVINGEANEADITAFRKVAKEYDVSEQDVSSVITEGEQARSAEAAPRQSPSESPAQQLGFVSEGLEQQTAPPPRQPDQRARLIEEEQARQRARNPEKAAALETLARLREKGMTVDDYARQGSLIGETPSPEKLKLLRELEGARAPVSSPVGDTFNFGPGAAAIGDVPAASTIEQLSEAIGKLPKGKGMRSLTASALDAADQVSKGKDWVVNALARMKAIGEAALTRPAVTEYKKDLGDFLYAAQRSDHETRQFAKQIKKQIPSRLRREAITNYIQAGGDMVLLAQRAAASKLRLRMGYEEAQRLTDEEKTVANNISSYYESRWQEANAAGILNGVVENYVNQAWSRPNEVTKNLMADVQRGLLEPNFRFAKQRIFDSFFEGEQIGRKPLSKDIGTLLSLYNQSLDRAIFSRQFILSLHDSVASDGRPLVEISGSGVPVPKGEEPPEQYSIRPHSRQPNMLEQARRKNAGEEPLDISDYQPIDHPALRGWKWLTNATAPKLTEAGELDINRQTEAPKKAYTPIYMKGDMLVHPEAYNHLNNVLGRSWFLGPSKLQVVARGVKRVQTTIKGTMFSMSGFHQVQEGTHAVGHKVSPSFILGEAVKDIPIVNKILRRQTKLDFDDPTQALLIKRGLQVASFDAMQEFSEGLTGGNLTNKIPVLGSKIFQPYQEWLFRDYIPRLKISMAMDAFERNEKRYSKTLNIDQIAELTAEQANAAFGELNYRYMGRHPSHVDAARVFLLAPDFLEARARFAGQALKPYGREQLIALGWLALAQYTSARILNKLFDDDYHWETENAFRIIHKKRWYGLRTVPADILHLVQDPRGFSYHRLSPVSVAAITALTRRDDRGQKVDAAEQITNFLQTPQPIVLRKHKDDAWWEAFANSMGLQEGKHYSDTEQVIRDYYKEKFPNGFPKAADPERQQIKKEIVKRQRAGEDQDDEIERLIEEGKLAKDDLKELHKKGKFTALQSSFIPLPLEIAVEAVEKARPEQKEELIPMLKKKMRRGLKKLPEAQRNALKERIDKIIE